MKKQKGNPYYQVPRELADSLAYRDLPNASKLLWHAMMLAYRGGNNGNINATLSSLERYGWRSTATLAKALAHLIAHGFLIETRRGGGNSCPLHQCCLYRFTHLPTNPNDALGLRYAAATFDYRSYDPRNKPKKISLTALKERAEDDHRFKKESDRLQVVKRQASENEDHISKSLQKEKQRNSAVVAATHSSQGFGAISS